MSGENYQSMKKLCLFACAAALSIAPTIASAEPLNCLHVIEPTIELEAPTRTYEKAVVRLNRNFAKLGKAECKAYNREHNVRTKPVVTRGDTNVERMELSSGVGYSGALEGRICCNGPAPAAN